jgi:hypothetical protein
MIEIGSILTGNIKDIIVACITGTALLGASYIAAKKGATKGSSKGSKELGDRLETGNGDTLGTTIHHIEQTQELMVTQLHSNSRDLTKLHDKIDSTCSKLDNHLIETKPLLKFVTKQMESKVSKRKDR